MKKFRKISYILLIVIIIVLSFTIYTNASNKNKEENQTDKTFSEILYIESKLVDVLNSMNNIETKKYNVSVQDITKESSKEKSGGTTEELNSSSSGGQSSSGGASGGNTSSTNTQNDKQDMKKYEMTINGTLTNQTDINWDFVKSEVENLYLTIPTLTIDLYKLDSNQEDVLNFNKEYDQLAIAVKEENKINTLVQASKLYDFLPKFLQKNGKDELKTKLVQVKANIFRGYSKLDDSKWNEISNDIKNAIDIYSKLLTDTNIDQSKQYSINKGYIIINELQNAVSVQDVSVFLIKYKNLVEEINNI